MRKPQKLQLSDRLSRQFLRDLDSDIKREVDKGLARMQGRVRTLKLDETAKARRAASMTAVILAGNIWSENSIIEEDRKGYLIPRKSLTSQRFLRLFDTVKEFDDVPFRQLDSESRAKLAAVAKQVRACHPDNRKDYAAKLMADVKLTYISGSNKTRLVWQSDQTLLRKSRIDSNLTVERVSSNGTRTFETETDLLPSWETTANSDNKETAE